MGKFVQFCPDIVSAHMSKSLLSINKAAALLGVSAKTLRRWEEKGKLIPQRTLGNQRRYALSDIKNLKSAMKTNTPQVSPKKNSTSSQAPASAQTPISKVEEQEEVVNESKSNFTAETPKKPITTGHFMSLHFSRALIHLPMIIISLFASLLVIGSINFYLANQNSLPFSREKIIKVLSLLHSNDNKKIKILGQEVLQAATQKHDFALRVNVPAEFMSTATVAGTLTAPNILYGLVAGNNITISGDLQNPTISASSSGGVSTLQGQSGNLQLAAGDGITIDGLTITNDDPGSDQNIFAKVKVGSDTISAGGNSDTLELVAGSGVTLTANTSSKKVTINSSGLSGLTTNGVLYADSANTATSLTPGTSGYILQSNGSGSPPSWVANAGNPSFSAITSGTNTSAAMVVGSGASLTYSGGTATSGVINANQLLGGTWAIPGSIGATTPNAGAFTTLSASGTLDANGQVDLGDGGDTFSLDSTTLDVSTLGVISGATGLTSSGTITFSAFTAGSALFAGTSGILQQDNSNFFFDDTNNRLGIGTNSNLAGALDVRGTSGTTPVASIAGQTSFASLIVDNSGVGDLFTASKSGAPKFTILNNGNLSWAGTGNFQTILTTAGTAAQTINIPDTAGTGGTFCLTTGNCAGVGGTGDVLGPGSSTDNALVRFNGTTGKSIQNSGIIIDDSNNVTGVNSLTIAPATDITALTLTGTNVTTQKLAYLNAKNVSGTIFDISYGATQTLTGSLIGQAIDLNNGQVTATNQNVTVEKMTLPTITNTITSGTKSLLGLQVTFGSGSGIEQNGSGGTTVYSALDVVLPALTQTAGTLTANGLAVTLPSGITTAGTANGILLSPTGVGAGTLNGVNIAAITAGSGIERAISVGSGWDNVLTVNGTSIINGSGVTQVAGGGTGLASYATGDLIYASGTTTLAARNIGNTGEVLTVSGGLPVWSTITGSSCTNCLINNPTSDQAISPTGQATTGLTVRQTSTASPTDDIFQVTDSTGSTKYFYVDNAGNVSTGAISNTTLTLTPTTNTTALTLVGTNVTTATNQYINTKNTSGTIVNLAYGAAQTLSTSLTTTGVNVDLSTNVTATEANVTGENLTLPAETNAHTTGTKTVKGVNVTSGGGLSQTGAGGTTNWSAFDATIPALTQSAGTLNAYGVNVTTPSSITTGGTAAALNVNASGVGAGSLYGLNISGITAGAGTETAINIGSGWDTDINATTSLEIGIGGTNELALSATNLNPGADGGNSLGASGTEWQNLFLNTGAVINFEASDVTLTHSANTLTLAGGDIDLGTNILTNIGATGTDFLAGGGLTLDDILTVNDDLTVALSGNENVEITDGATPTTDTLSIVANGATVTADANALEIDFTTGDGSDVTNSALQLDLSSGGTGAGDIILGLNLSMDAADASTQRGINFADNNFDTDINATTDLTLGIGGTNEVILNATDLSPATSDGSALGTGSLMWSDLFLASGGVINFNNGDVTLTHAADSLTIAGGDLNVGIIDGQTINFDGDGSPTADLVQIGSGDTSATDGVDALQLTFTSDDASGNVIDITPTFTDNDAGNNAETWNVVDIDALTVTQNDSGGAVTGIVRGVNIGNLTESATGDDAITSSAINLGTGWDTLIGGTTAGTNLLSFTNATLTTAGALTLASTLAVNGGSITSTGALALTPTTTLTLNSTGDMTLDSSTDIILDADGADVILKDATTTFATFTNLSTDLIINAAGDDVVSNDRWTIGSQTPTTVAALDVKGLSGTLSVASVSGTTSFAAMVVDNTIGDLFTASSSGLNRFVITQAGNVGIGTTLPATTLDIDSNSNTQSLRLRGLAETTEIADIFVNVAGGLVISTVPGASTSQYIDLRSEDDEYGLIIRDSSGASTTPFANFYMNDATTDYLNINVGNSNATTGLVLQQNGSTGVKVGIGVTTPLATLDVRGNSGTTPVASVSGNTILPALIVDNAGGDIFSASKSGKPLFSVKQDRVQIGTGSATGNVIPTFLALDVKANGGDPVGGAEGYMYYNTSDNKFRCYQNTGWVDCVGATAEEHMQAEMQTLESDNADIVANDHIQFQTVQSSSGSSISLDTTTTYTDGAGASVGRFTLAANKTYLLRATVPEATFTGGAGYIAYRWYNLTGATQFGSAAVFVNTAYGVTSKAYGGYAEATITPTVSTVVELRIVESTTADSVGNTGTARYPSAFIEVLGDGTSVPQFSGATSTTDGTQGYIPQPLAGEQGSVLMGDGDWSSPTQFSLGRVDTLSIASVSGKSNSFAALVVDNSGTGDIFTASSSGLNRFVIKNNGNVGIGTKDPVFRLHLEDSQSATGAAMIYNTNTGNNADGLIVKLGITSSLGTTCATSGNCNEFVTFLNGNGVKLGKIHAASDTTITYKANGSDYAELFKADTSLLPADFTNEDLNSVFSEGTIVCQGQNGAIPCSSNSKNKIIGPISTAPSFLGGPDGPDKIIVALLGQVPVRVSTENGDIHTGDLLTLSQNTPGLVMKATKAGFIVGKALENYSPTENGKVKMYISLNWYDPDIYLTDTGNINIFEDGTDPQSGQTLFGIKDENDQEIKRVGVFSDAVVGNLKSGYIHAQALNVAGNIDTQKLILAGQDVNDRLNLLEQQATGAGQLTNQSSDLQNSILSLSDRVASVEATLNLANIFNFTASSSSELNLDSLNVVGRTLLSDVGITGRVNIGLLSIDGLSSCHPELGSGSTSSCASINSIGTLKLQSQSAGDIDILNGKVTIDTEGNITTLTSLTAQTVNTTKLNIIDDPTSTTSAILSSSAGSVTIEAGDISIDVDTTALTANSLIFVTPDQPVIIGAKKKDSDTFTIKLQSPAAQNMKVNWWIVN